MRGRGINHVISATAADPLPVLPYYVFFGQIVVGPKKNSAKIIEKETKKTLHIMAILEVRDSTRSLNDLRKRVVRIVTNRQTYTWTSHSMKESA